MRRRWLVGLWFGACGGDGGGGTVIVGSACETPDTVSCARINPGDDEADHVAACVDGTYEELVRCPEREVCVDPGIDGAVACTEINTFVPYAVLEGPCDGAGLACEADRDRVLRCEGGAWVFDTDCTISIQECGVPNGSGEAMCLD